MANEALYTADVLIIGGGGSGMAAAISAATSGATVIILEKAPKVGGSTGMSVGSFTAARTSYQYRERVNDSVELFIEDMKTANGPREELENVELRRVLAENSGPTVEWLSSIGVQFLGPTPEPPYEKPRMHNVIPNSKAYAFALRTECERLGVSIHTSMQVDGLLRNAAGEYVGASAAGQRFFGRRGVILATGDYSASPEFKAVNGPDAARVPPVNPYNTGDGIRLGHEAGGVMVQMDRTYEGLRFFPSTTPDLIKSLPPHPKLARGLRFIAENAPKPLMAAIMRGALTSWIGPNNTMYAAGAILVDNTGVRIGNEDSDVALARAAVAPGRDNRSYMVFDAQVAEKFSAWPNPVSTFPGVAYAYVHDYKTFRPDVYHRADTIEELAAAIGVDPIVLASTVDRWNETVDRGGDDEFGRTRLGVGVRKGPFYALGPMGSFVTLTDGGLAVDTDLRVTDATGEPIPGLWAAGSTGQGGLQLLNHGLHIGWALVSGRLVGRHVATAPERRDLVPVE